MEKVNLEQSNRKNASWLELEQVIMTGFISTSHDNCHLIGLVHKSYGLRHPGSEASTPADLAQVLVSWSSLISCAVIVVVRSRHGRCGGLFVVCGEIVD